MDLKIIAIHNHGDFKNEYVMLQAVDDCDVGHFILSDSTYLSDGRVSNKLRHTYWFPDKKVKKGEFVSLWTCSGTAQMAKTEQGSPIHRFYWGLNTAVWNDDGDCGVLLDIRDWQHHKAKS